MEGEQNAEAVAAVDAAVEARLNLKYESNADSAGHLAPGAEKALLTTFESLQSMFDELNNGEEKDDESVRFETKLESCMAELPAFLKGQLEAEKKEVASEAA